MTGFRRRMMLIVSLLFLMPIVSEQTLHARAIAADTRIDARAVGAIRPAPLLTQATIASSAVPIEYVGGIGTQVAAIAVDGSFAYIGEADRFTILDIRNPAVPSQMSSLPLLGISAIRLQGSFAYVASSISGLWIIDVSNVLLPRLRGHLTTLQARDVKIVAGVAYIADGISRKLLSVDISNPDSPTLIGSYELPNNAITVEVANGLAYVAVQVNQTVVVDVSDPVHPAFRGNVQICECSMQIVGHFAYVPSGSAGLGAGGLVIYDLQDPIHPVVRSVVPTTHSAMSVQVVGSTAYVADYASFSGGIQIVDVANPDNPIVLSTIATPAARIAFANGFVYTSAGKAGVRVIDARNPAAPALYGQYDAFDVALGITVVGNLLYVAGSESGFQIIDRTVPARPTIRGSYVETNIDARNVHVVGNVAYVASHTGLLIFDVHNPDKPMLIGADRSLSANDVAIVGQLAYVAEAANNLTILDISDPAHITVVGQYTNLGFPTQIQVVGNLAYVMDGKLSILDVSNPASPTFVGDYASSGNFGASARAVQVIGTRAYIADSSNGFHIVDVSDPSTPTLLGSFTSIPHMYSVQVVGNLAYVAAKDAGLELIDISNPAQPALRVSYTDPGASEMVRVVGKLTYITDSEGGLEFLRVHPDLFPTSASITPSGGQLANADTSVSLEFPAQAVSSTTQLTYTGLLTPSYALDAGRLPATSFMFEARTNTGATITQFGKPYTMRVSYTDEDLADLDIDEQTLTLLFWNGSAWVDVLPCSGCAIDTLNNQVTVTFNHVGQFALVGNRRKPVAVPTPQKHVFLPFTRR